MRYVMREKLLSWGDDYYIQDETGRNVYFVDGKVFSIRNRLSFQDMSGTELAFIQQKLMTWGPTYDISSGGRHLATVKKQLFSFLNCRFYVDVPGPDDLVAAGNFLYHEYTFTRHGSPVAQVSKHWFTWSDTYGVEVVEGEDPVLVLASTVVIDQVCHDDKQR